MQHKSLTLCALRVLLPALFLLFSCPAESSDLIFYSLTFGGGDTNRALAREHERLHPGDKVTLREVLVDERGHSASDAARQFVPPDVIQTLLSPRVREAFVGDHLANLTEVWDRHGLWAGVPSGLRSSVLHPVSGVPVGVPFAVAGVGFLYRRSMLALAGLEPPKDFAGLMGLIQELAVSQAPGRTWRAPLVSSIGLGKTPSMESLWWLDYIAARMFGPVYHADLIAGKVTLTNDTNIRAALKMMTDIAVSGAVVDTGEFYSNVGAFLGGVAPLYFGSTAVGTAVPQLAPDIGTFSFPALSLGVPQGEVASLALFSVPERSAEKAGAMRFIETVLSPGAYRTQVPAGGAEPISVPVLPMHQSTIASMPYASTVQKMIFGADTLLGELGKTAHVEYSNALTNLLRAAVGGSAEAAEDGAAPSPDAQAIASAVEANLIEAEGARVRTFLGLTPSPAISPAPGAYEAPHTVTITAAAGAIVRYTSDGSVPTDLSAEYTGPITFASAGDLTVRYFAQSPSLRASPRTAAQYSITGGSLSFWDDLAVYVLPAAGAALLLLILAVVLVRRRLAASRASQWRIDPADVTVNRDAVLGMGSFGIVFEGTFRGSAVAVKELFLSRKEHSLAGSHAATQLSRSRAPKFGTARARGGGAPRAGRSYLASSAGAGQGQGGSGLSNKIAPAASAPGSPLGVTLTATATEAWIDDDAGPDDREGLVSRTGTDISHLAVSRSQGNHTYNIPSKSNNNTQQLHATAAIFSASSDGGAGNDRRRAARLRAGFEAEVAVLSTLRHPNCLFLYGAYLTKTRAGLVVERMRSSVHDLLQTRTVRLSAARRVALAADAANGLAYLHAHKPPILHRDLKSQNLLVSDRGECKVADFGLSELKGSKGASIGSAPWTAPEVWINPKSYSTASDVYSLGVTLWEIATSGEVWVSPEIRTVNDIRERVLDGKRPPLSPGSLAEGIPADMALLIDRCWAQDPENRPSMTEVRDRLREIAETVPDGVESGASVTLLDQLIGPTAAAKLVAAAGRGEAVPPLEFPDTTICFMDIAGYTELSTRVDPSVMTQLLTNCFDIFEEILEAHGLVKIDTIGDCFIFGGGMAHRVEGEPADTDHASRVTLAVLEMLKATSDIPIDPTAGESDHDPLGNVRWRCGVASGPIAAALVGKTSPKVQVVGDAVNTASRMESTGTPGKVQVTQGVRDNVTKTAAGRVMFRARGVVDVKGKGSMSTFWAEDPPVTPGMGAPGL